MTDQARDGAGPDLPAERDEKPHEEEVLPLAGPRRVLETLQNIVELEGRRVGVQEGRNKIAMRALDLGESADQRQYGYHMERLASEERQKEKSRGLARLVILIGGGSVLVLAVLVTGMAFFGDETQAGIALTMLSVEQASSSLSPPP